MQAVPQERPRGAVRAPWMITEALIAVVPRQLASHILRCSVMTYEIKKSFEERQCCSCHDRAARVPFFWPYAG